MWLEDGNVVLNLGPVPLRNALCDPHNVASLLLLETHVRIEDAKVELLHEGTHIDFNLCVSEGERGGGGREGEREGGKRRGG